MKKLTNTQKMKDIFYTNGQKKLDGLSKDALENNQQLENENDLNSNNNDTLERGVKS